MRILALAAMLLGNSGCWLLFDGDDDGGGGGGGPCVPTLTCESQGYDCGTAVDECGGDLECGTCDEPGWECGAGGVSNVCGCVPFTCEQELSTCGEIQDGCGSTFVCGPCDGPSECGIGGDDHVCALSDELRVCDEASGFCWENPYPVPFTPFDTFARTADDIWAVGYEGQIRHYDGTRWEAVPSGVDVLLRGVWASSATNAWAVGLQGTLLHWDGGSWDPVDLGTLNDLNDVHGTTASNVWVVGSGVGFKWNGATWSPSTTNTPPTLYHVYTAGATKGWATGGGRVWTWSATNWTAETVENDELTLNGIAGRGDDEIYAVGWDDDGDILDPDFSLDELVYAYNGATWERIDTAAQGPIRDIYVTGSNIVAVRAFSLFALSGPAVTAQPEGEATMVGAGTPDDAQVVITDSGGPQRFVGGAWIDDRYGPVGNFDVAGRVGESVWFTSGDQVVAWIGGGAVVTTPPPGEVLAVAGASPNEVVAALVGGIYDFDGHGWTEEAEAPAAVDTLREAGGVLHALGDGITARGEDGSWTPEHEAAGYRWADIAAEGEALWAVGQRTVEQETFGAIGRRVGGAWTELSLAGFTGLCSVVVLGTDNVWVGGWLNGVAQVSRWNGATWSAAEELGGGQACDLRSLGGAEIAAVVNGALWRRTGGEWQEWLPHPTGAFVGLEADAAGGLWLAGSEGAVLHRAPPP